MAHCISLDETLPTKSMDIATQNITHIHYANSQSQTNNTQVGCYQNAEQYTYYYTCHGHISWHYEGDEWWQGRCDSCGTIYNAGYGPGGHPEQDYPNGCTNRRSQIRTRYRCPYTAGETLMSISVLHMDKVGARRTLTINFDDQITSAGSVISYAWNTGATTQSITVNQRGTYYCDVTWQETQSQVNHTVRLTYTF